MKLIRSISVLFFHYLKLSIRNPIWLMVSLFFPVCYLYLYEPLLRGFVGQPGFSSRGTLVTFIPGLLIMLALFGTMYVGFAILEDLKSGVIERLRVTPVSRIALLLGRSLRDVAILVVQSIIIIVLALPLGLHVSLLEVLMVLGIMALVGLFMAPLSYSLALTLHSEDAVMSIINFTVQPMLLLSGILLPLSFAPKWLQIVGSFNPLKYVVDASRALFNGNIESYAVLYGILFLMILVIISICWGVRAFGKALS